MNTERLNDLLSVLRTVPDEQFRITTWWRTNCKTVGCAVGHYIVARPDCGLVLEKCKFAGVHELHGPNAQEWEAVERHFGLTERQATYLFAGWKYDDDQNTTRAEVIERIEKFIAGGGFVPLMAQAD